MNLREELLREHSKAQCDRIVAWVGKSQERFDLLFKLFTNDIYRVVQRAAWPVSYCVIKHPEFLNKHWVSFIKNLQEPNLHDAIKRNSVRLLQTMDIPKKHQGAIMDICFKYLESPNEAVAIKVFSLTVLGNLSKQYPDIIPELKLLIEDQMPNQTIGFRTRAKKLLKNL